MTRPLQLRTLGSLLLSDADGAELLRRRIDLALLTFVSDRSPAPVKREALQALFWGERTEEKARQSLRQVMLRLRQTCGDALEVKADSVRVVGGSIDVDARRFSDAATSGRWPEAVAEWHGVFLPECEDIGIEAFRTWLEVERERLRRLLAHAFERAVSEAPAGSASSLTSAWVRHFPLDEAAHRWHIEALCAESRVAEADAVRSAFVVRLREEMQETPSDVWMAATSSAIDAARAAERPTPRVSPPGRVPDIEPDAPVAPSRVSRRTMMTWAVGAAGIVAIAVLALTSRNANAKPDRFPALAVGEITSAFPHDSVRGFATLLTIDLARIAELNVISERRLSEVATNHADEGIEAAARSAGARELIEGVLSRRDGSMIRADLRRIDLATGKTRAAYSVEAKDLSALADVITEEVAHDLGIRVKPLQRSGVTTSIVAYRLYEQGLRAYYDGDASSARRFFASALVEDSTFAMAALYAAMTTSGFAVDSAYERAVRLAHGTNDRERLLIYAARGRLMRDPRVFAWAETLVTRYPSEPEPHLIYAGEMRDRRNLPASLAHYRRVVEMDSANRDATPACRACEGLYGMIGVYLRMDSTRAAEQLARTGVRWQPTSASSWSVLSSVLGAQERYAEAHAAIDSAARRSTDPLAVMDHAIWWIRTGDFALIDRMCADLIRSPKVDVRKDALWTAVISLRTQGRVREALALARQFRRESAPRSEALLEAVTLMEAGDARRSAALFDTLARSPQPPFPSRVGAQRSTHYTFVASALAAAADTSRLAALEDSVRVNGELATERYRTLHRYVRGLRLSAAGKHAEAATAFRDAIHDGQTTYVRVYLELARSLMAAGRPAEAVDPLRAALSGPTSATGLYASRTELQELLGQAFERSNAPDSALVQYRRVAHAWKNADVSFSVRRAAVEASIARLTSR